MRKCGLIGVSITYPLTIVMAAIRLGWALQ
jgi:hypothetical protein